MSDTGTRPVTWWCSERDSNSHSTDFKSADSFRLVYRSIMGSEMSFAKYQKEVNAMRKHHDWKIDSSRFPASRWHPNTETRRIQSSWWLEQKESNLHQRSQSPLPYHWAMPHSFRVIIITYIRRKVNKKDFVIVRFDYSSRTAFFARSYHREFVPFFCLLFIEPNRNQS